MFNRFVLPGAAALATFCLPVAAADLGGPRDVPPIVVPSVMSWSGFYGGVKAGYAFAGDGDLSLTSRTGLGTANTGRAGLNGGQFGGFAGFNWQAPQSSVVFGTEVDVTGGRMRHNVGTPSLSPFAASFAGRSTSDWNGSLRLRAAYAFDRALIYTTGGVALLDHSYRANIGNGSSINKTNPMVGWTVGAGVDYAVTQNIFTGVEYRYTGTGKDGVPDSANAFVAQRSANFHSFGLRVGTKF